MSRRKFRAFGIAGCVFSALAACASLEPPPRPQTGPGVSGQRPVVTTSPQLAAVQPAEPPASGGRSTPARPGDVSVESAAIVALRNARGTSAGARVLTVALRMMAGGTIVVGGCWDYVNRAFNDAGFPAQKRLTVFTGPEAGPYAEPSLIKPGDWLYFENLTFGGIGHSALFVDWIDFDTRTALTIEYVGQNKVIPGRYREYDVTKCFGIYRGKE